MEVSNIPKHIGFIMDGNGRWAKKRGMPRNFGHKQGAAVFKKTINWCREFGVHAATFYAFSTENWKRPEDEVKGIMNLLRQYIKDIKAEADGAKEAFKKTAEEFFNCLEANELDVSDFSRGETGVCGFFIKLRDMKALDKAIGKLVPDAALDAEKGVKKAHKDRARIIPIV